MKTITVSAALAGSVLLASGAAAYDTITEAEVNAAQQAWGEGIVAIGAAYTANEDYEAAAAAHIERFYAYGSHDVLFKPTLASDDQFRGTFDEALSYFVGGSIAEDNGFAIAPYTNVRWENEGTLIDADSAVAMGNYFFTTTEGNEVKVEYSFGYVRGDDGELRIVLHHSSLPFSAE
ncbi:phosphoribosyl-AMP cyclohydrolase [Hyphobacterium sp.]|uniref:phosphoribosyl-AMP cyclohydrolase n=1 Tax=Hyphobacterium sp. TaxID=2004662 RepID=UPI003BA89A60